MTLYSLKTSLQTNISNIIQNHTLGNKTLVAQDGKALYFSRSAVPHVRGIDPSYWYKY